MKDVLDIPRTAMEVFNMLPEGTLCEVIDNTLYMSPSPTSDHQDILGDIHADIRIICRTGKIGKAYMAPLDVYLDNEQNVVGPDLVFIKAENLEIIKKRGIFGIPDLVIEVLSSNKAYDKEKKFALYQHNQIPEYIIIDPDTKEVWHYILKEGSYVQQPGKPGQINSEAIGQDIHF